MKTYSFLSLLKSKKVNSLLKLRRYSIKLSSEKEDEEFNGLKYSINSKYSTNSTNGSHRLYSFGLTEHGGLGLRKEGQETRFQRYIARPVRHLFGEENCVTDVSCGFGFTAIAINSNDTFKVYGCGINTDKQICGDQLDLIHSPYPINLGIHDPSTRINSLSAGRAHLAVATSEGVFLLGSNCFGQCGRTINPEERSSGAFIVNCIPNLDGEIIKSVNCGQDHTLFLTESGAVYGCGLGSDGQIGCGGTDNVCYPIRIRGVIENECIIKIDGRSDTILALSNKGEVFGWGNNEFLQLSPTKEIEQRNEPIQLGQLNKIGKVKDIAAGGSFCLAVLEDGNVYTWGYGILGAGPQVQKSNIPISLPKTLFGYNECAPNIKVDKVYCGLTYMIAINSAQHIYCWGHNKHGCLGIGHLKDQYFPYKVGVSALAVKASCGVDHTMVLCKPFG